MNELALVITAAIVNGVFAAIGLYIGFTKGTAKTVDIALDKIQKRSEKSPTFQRLIKAMEMTDKIFGDEQAVEQFIRFFKGAADLVGSPEAKNFFENATELMKSLGEPQKVSFKMPEKKKTERGIVHGEEGVK